MTRRHVDIDEDKLAIASAILGTTGVRETVDGALDELLALHERRQSLLSIATNESDVRLVANGMAGVREWEAEAGPFTSQERVAGERLLDDLLSADAHVEFVRDINDPDLQTEPSKESGHDE